MHQVKMNDTKRVPKKDRKGRKNKEDRNGVPNRDGAVELSIAWLDLSFSFKCDRYLKSEQWFALVLNVIDV